ncbi:hypothetical protein FA95DRAFT_1608108 [Auriscalpium vulgare]|uniref:Uncharacterized protein n=1 Tax=Auriscalpium vulgare TaxID=40419 RepID=A0ACB8RLM1_9AGAM|nr:hypothetical protein FA95DRAFT_1608108 [Auriscalpium vulgare]
MSEPLLSNDAAATVSTEAAPKPPRIRKKRRTTRRTDAKPTSSHPSLDAMPVEIIAEILTHVPSPREVLAVTRCNRHLHAMLRNPGNASIWRRAREQCHVGEMPAPPPGMSEPAHAAFVLDGGTCEVCKKSTNNMYFSYALRIRLCGRTECRTKGLPELLATNVMSSSPLEQFILSWIPRLEEDIMRLDNSSFHWLMYRHTVLPRKKEYASAVDEYNKVLTLGLSVDEWQESHLQDVFSLEAKQKHACILIKWRKKWDDRANEIRKKNIKLALEIADREGWDKQSLLDSPTYGALHRAHCNALEKVPLFSFEIARAQIEGEVLHISEERVRREKEHAYQVRLDDVARHLERLRAATGKPAVLPTLTSFRSLPVIKLMQAKDTDASGVDKELKSSDTIRDFLQSDLEKWVAAARSDLGEVLGFPRWKNASSKVLHPVDRVTARFICQRCHHVSNKYADAQSLDFAGACAHECPGLDKKMRKRSMWKADQFIPDQKGINVISRAVVLAGSRAEDEAAKGTLEGLAAVFVCKSCDPAIVMDFRRLVGHCKRHDDMQFALVSPTEANVIIGNKPYEAGLYAKVNGRTPEAKKLQEGRNFVCRHCVVAPDAGKRAMIFHGLVSHLKQKHGITHVGDEDFYQEK